MPGLPLLSVERFSWHSVTASAPHPPRLVPHLALARYSAPELHSIRAHPCPGRMLHAPCTCPTEPGQIGGMGIALRKEPGDGNSPSQRAGGGCENAPRKEPGDLFRACAPHTVRRQRACRCEAPCSDHGCPTHSRKSAAQVRRCALQSPSWHSSLQ